MIGQRQSLSGIDGEGSEGATKRAHLVDGGKSHDYNANIVIISMHVTPTRGLYSGTIAHLSTVPPFSPSTDLEKHEQCAGPTSAGRCLSTI